VELIRMASLGTLYLAVGVISIPMTTIAVPFLGNNVQLKLRTRLE
jgi:hypothetical protein